MNLDERTIIWDAVTGAFVDACADRLWEAVIVERRGISVVSEDLLCHQSIDIICRYSWL